jgi:hypothetical protein
MDTRGTAIIELNNGKATPAMQALELYDLSFLYGAKLVN